MSTRKTRHPLIAANWKMNIGPAAAAGYMSAFLQSYPPRNDRRVLFFPPAVSLTTVASAVSGRKDIAVGVQNIYAKDSGAYTGEVSGPLAHEAGAEFCLVGHSERRQLFDENDDEVRQKCRAALRAGMSPMLCVGEARHERYEGRTMEVVGRQVRAVISALDESSIAAMSIAYEPLWAIGTGENATASDASDVHRHIRFLLRQSVGSSIADNIHILYGGSVNPDNAGELLAAPDVDGLLVGGASLKVDSWLQVVNA
jgi:triosephosphate isomerase